MAKLPETFKLKIEQVIEDRVIENHLRPYLGLSQIGDNCARKLWYSFRFVAKQKLTPRQDRLLNRGHREEPVIVADLKKAGVICHHVLDDQKEITAGFGHIKGHCDGIGENIPDAPKTPHLLEFKTASDKNFKKIVSGGYLAYSNTYKGQVMCYMYRLKLKRALAIVVNKNDDSRYYERIEANNEHAKELIQRGEDIIMSKFPMQRIGGPSWYECKWCDYYNICHFGEPVLHNCRTCTHSEVCDEGIWWCEKFDKEIDLDKQRKGCDKFFLMEGLANV